MAIKSLYRSWMIIAKNYLQNQLLTPSSSFLFLIGKIFNYIFAVVTIYAIFTQTSHVQGYTLPQAVIVVLVFSFIETVVQFFFRSLYTFRQILIKGDFDLDLLKPLPSFFRPILSGPDFLDLPMIFIQFGAIIFFFDYYHFSISLSTFIIALFTFISAFILSFSIHLAIAGFAILTTEIDSLVMVYRSLGRAAVVPTDIYGPVFRFFLNYIVPITVIMTIPAQALLGLLTPSGVIYALITTFIFLLLSLLLWYSALRRYTSASS